MDGGIDVTLNLTHTENVTFEVNNSTEQCNKHERAGHMLFELGLYGIVVGSICIAGFVGNTISFLVLRKDRSTPVASFLLQALAVADNAFLFLWFIHYSIRSFLKLSNNGTAIPGFSAWTYIRVCTFPVLYMAQTQTIWQTVVIALNRFMAVCMPYRAPHLCNINNVYKEVFIVTVFSFLYNVPRFFEQQIYVKDNITHVTRTSFGSSTIYDVVYTDALYYLFSFFLPLAILAFVNTRVITVYRATQRRRQRMTSSGRRSTENDNNITLVMIMIVVIFIICQAPARIVQIVWEYKHQCQPYKFYIIHFTNTLEVLNSSVNFLIYCVFHKRFRDIMRRHFCCCPVAGWKRDSAWLTTTEGLSLEEAQKTTPGSSKVKTSSPEHNLHNGNIPVNVCDKSVTMVTDMDESVPESVPEDNPEAPIRDDVDDEDVKDATASSEDLEYNCTEPRDDIMEPLSP